MAGLICFMCRAIIFGDQTLFSTTSNQDDFDDDDDDDDNDDDTTRMSLSGGKK